MSNNCYVICDENYNVLLLTVRAFDKDVIVSAIFTEEQDALDILFECEVRELLNRPHAVRVTSTIFKSEKA